MRHVNRSGGLRLDRRHKKLGGVCAGIGNYMGWSHCSVRVATVIATLFVGHVTIPLYIIAYLILEDERRFEDVY